MVKPSQRLASIDEGVAAFIKGINNSPEEEKDGQIELAKEQIKNLSVAMISLRADRFAKWPDEEESAGFISALTSILGTVVSFLAQTGIMIPVSEIMEPVANQINQSVVKAYQNVILPEYKSDRYPWPDDMILGSMIIKKSTLLNWIDVIEGGEREYIV